MNTSFDYPTSGASRHLRSFLAVLAATAALAGPQARAVKEPSALTGENKSYALSWQDEVKEGAEADKEITQQMGLYDSPQVQAYVQSVGQRVLQTSTFANPSTPELYRNTKFTFRVLDSSVVNAFALPGGYVYVTRGLLSHVDNEAQLAVVLGHEIAHVAARHSSQQARRSQWTQLGVIAGAILGQAVLGDKMPNLAENVLNTGGQAAQVFMLRYSREAENEADTLGVQYALNSGYAAEDSARFFDALRRLSQTEGKGLPSWLSSHPDPGNRADHVIQLATANRPNPASERKLGTDEFLRVIDGIIIGEDPRQGFTQNGVFYHPTLHFQMPVAQGWKFDNQPGAVVFAEPNGKAIMGLRIAGTNRTHDAATQFVSQNKVQVTGNGDTTINGLPTTVVLGQVATEQGQVGVWNAFIEFEGKVYSLLGYTPAQAFEQMRPTFESVASGFSPLRDARMANVQPSRLRIVRADRRAPLATFIPTSLPQDVTAEKVAIMNQLALNEEVPQGAALKVPEASAATSGQPIIATVDPSAQGTQPYPAGTYPPQPYPSSSQNYPASGQASPYPPQSYPGANSYPQQGSGSYPPSQPYPQQGSNYPATSSSYPPQQTYPQQTYPQQQSYPQQQGYPPQQTNPQTYPSYPQSGAYPQTQSPYGSTGTGSYPQSSPPQFPQPGSTTTPTQSPQTTPTPWPR